MPIMHLKFAQLPVSDQDRALAFYTDKFDFEVATDAPYEGSWRWIELSIPGAETDIVFAPAVPSMSGEKPGLVFTVKDLDATYEALLAKGVEFTQALESQPWSPNLRFALCKDSEGNMIMLGTG